MTARKEKIYLPSCSPSPLNLNVGEKQKRFIELVAKSKGMAMSDVVMDVLKVKFPKASSDNSYNEWVKAAAKASGMTMYGWSQFSIAQSITLFIGTIEPLSVEEAAELIHLYFKFTPSKVDRPTSWDNAIRYIRGEKEADLSWTIATKNKLDELKGFYINQDEDKEFGLYNPLNK